ncbi:hypothetical protein EV182_006646, partial [Spiromyces aspiralis]
VLGGEGGETGRGAEEGDEGGGGEVIAAADVEALEGGVAEVLGEEGDRMGLEEPTTVEIEANEVRKMGQDEDEPARIEGRVEVLFDRTEIERANRVEDVGANLQVVRRGEQGDEAEE